MKKYLTFNLGVEAWCINFSILRDETFCMSTFTPILKAVLSLFAALKSCVGEEKSTLYFKREQTK